MEVLYGLNTDNVESSKDIKNRGIIENCYNASYVKGNLVGGICGTNKGGTIDRSINVGCIEGESSAGGIVQSNTDPSRGNANSAIISNCYNTGNVNGKYSKAGGIASLNSYGTIKNCYNIGLISAGKKGEIIAAYAHMNGVTGVYNCYFLDSSTNIGTEEIGQRKTQEQMESYDMIDLLNTKGDEAWKIGIDEYLYPMLNWQNESIDIISPTLDVKYSSTELTNKDIKVTIMSNEKLQEVEGWELSQDKLQLTKTYSKNTTENIVVKDLAGNQTTKNIIVNNIDKTKPVAKAKYNITEQTNQNVTVTITSNEQIQEVEGWTLSEDKLKLTKQYSENKEETITVKDLAGNESQVSIKITSIVKESNSLKGDINKDGQINTVDMIKILRHIAVTKNQETEEKNPTWKLTGELFTIADINEDGQVNTTDLLKILRHISASKDDEIKEKHPDWILTI